LALQATEHSTTQQPKTVQPSEAAALSKPDVGKRISVWTLTAMCALSLLIGFAAGVIVTVKYPDGTVVEHHVPDGAQVTVRPEGNGSQTPNADNSLSPRQKPTREETSAATQQGNSSEPKVELPAIESQVIDVLRMRSPFYFGIVAPADSNEPTIEVDVGQPLRESLLIPGTQRARIYADSNRLIMWNDIQGQMSANVTFRSTTLIFEPALAARMKSLTKSNLDKYLAVIVDGKLVVAPRIVSVIEHSAEMSGMNAKYSRFLYQALNGLVDPSPDEGGASREAKEELAEVSEGDVRKERMKRYVSAQYSLKQIGMALLQYQNEHRNFPPSQHPPRVKNQQSDEGYAYSWRVAILPYLGDEGQRLHQLYRFHEPWDSEENLRLLGQMPSVFAGTNEDSLSGYTHYVGFSGEHTALGTFVGRRLLQFTDGTSNSLMVVESKTSIPWTKPEDFANESQVKPLFGKTVQFLTADGAVHRIDDYSENDLAPWITIDGGERIED
ncbi:MAG: DUF1559 domain-containing protein, partial [Planctomycetales bacterium]|nr:DUF1559 domain-containing protein [Planctomycetales bacterium]